MRRYIVATLILLVVLAGCGGCPKRRTTEFLSDFGEIIDEWDDTTELAGGTSRIALSPVIERLQSLKRQVGDLETPCEDAEALQAATITYMDLTIDAFLAFATQASEEAVQNKFKLAESALQKTATLWAELKATTQ